MVDLTNNRYFAKWMVLPLMAAIFLFSTGPFMVAQELPETILRFEKMLLDTPVPGPAFDRVYQYFQSGPGLEALETRWATEGGQGDKPGRSSLLLGMVAQRRGDTATAQRLFAESIRLEPSRYTGFFLLGNLHLDEGRLADAISAYKAAVKIGVPMVDRQDVYTRLARTQQRFMDSEGALETWNELVEFSPDDPYILEEAAAILVENNRHEAALEFYRRLEKLAQNDPYRRMTARMKQAQIEMGRGRLEEALQIYQKTLEEASSDSWYYREISSGIEDIFRRKDDVFGLISWYEDQLQGSLRNVETALQLSRLLTEVDRLDDALSWMEKASNWAPDRTDVKLEWGSLLVLAEKFDRAETVFKDLSGSYPGEWTYRERWGEVHWRQFEKSRDEKWRGNAIEIWRRLVPEDSEIVAEIVMLGDLYRRYGCIEEAIMEYRRSLKLAPDAFDLRERLALFFFSLGDEKNAWTLLEEHPDPARDPAYYLRLAQFQRRYGKDEDALKTLSKSLLKFPLDFNLQELRWRVLFEREHWKEALAAFPELLSSTDNEFYIDELETRYVHLLKSSGFLNVRREELMERWQNDAQLSESDFRIYLRITLLSGDPTEIRGLLNEGRSHFPESFLIAQLNTEFVRQTGSVEEQVKAWRELMQLRPRRKAEWLRQIVNTYRQKGLWKETLAAASDCIAAFPADPQSHILYADTCFLSGSPEEGIKALKAALRLADNPHDIRKRLARALREEGMTMESITVYLDAFHFADSVKSRLALIRPLVELSLLEGDLDGLIDRFKAKIRQHVTTWEFNLFLSEIYETAQDFPKARDALDRALVFRPNDPRLLKQLIQLTERDNDTNDRVNYARMLARLEPTPENEISYAHALLETGQTEGALPLLVRNRETLLNQPFAWKSLFPAIKRAGAMESFGNLLMRDIDVSGVDSRNLLGLAEFFILSGDDDTSSQLLWKILDLETEIRRPEPDLETIPDVSEKTFVDRLQEGALARQAFQGLVASRFGEQEGKDSRGTIGGGSIRSLAQCQIYALVYLSGIASLSDRQNLFIEQLKKRLEILGTGPEGRILAFLWVLSRSSFLGEVSALLDSGFYNSELYQFCHDILTNTVFSQVAGNDVEEMEALLYRIERSIEQREPETAGSVHVTKARKVMNFGRPGKAYEYLNNGIEYINWSDPEQAFPAFSILLEQGEIERVRNRLITFLETPGKPIGKKEQVLIRTLLPVYTKSIIRGKQWVDGDADILLKLLTLGPADRTTSQGSSSGSSKPQSIQVFLNFPPPTAYIGPVEISMFRQLYNLTAHTAFYGLIYRALENAENIVPPDRVVRAHLTAAFFDWWQGEREEAFERMKESAINRNDDDDLNFMAGEMAFRLNRFDEAGTFFDKVNAGNRESLRAAARIRLYSTLKHERDQARSREILSELATLNIPKLPGINLHEEFRRLGIEQPEEGGKQSSVTVQNSGANLNHWRNRMAELVKKKKPDEVEKMAREMLGRTFLTSSGNNQSWARKEALKQLHQINRLDPYVADLQKQLKASPNSVRLLSLLAEAYGILEDSNVGKDSIVLHRRSQSTFPLHVRMVRRGEEISAFISVDGKSWELVQKSKLKLEERALAGVALSSGSMLETTDCELDRLTLFSLSKSDDEGFPTGNGNLGKPLKAWHETGIGLNADGGTSRLETGDILKMTTRSDKLGGRSDHFYFLYQELFGDGEIEVSLNYVDRESRQQKMGLMFRDSLDAGSRNIFCGLEGRDKFIFQVRRYSGEHALHYYRQLHEMHPFDRNFADLFGQRLEQDNRFGELLEFYTTRLNSDLMDTLNRRPQLVKVFSAAGKIPQLVENILKKEFPPMEISAMAGKGPQDAAGFLRLGSRLKEAGHREAALSVWQKGLASIPSNFTGDLRKMLLAELDESREPEAVAKLLADYLLPESPDIAQSLWLGRQIGGVPRVWYGDARRVNNGRVLPAYELLKGVRNKEVLHDIREKGVLLAETGKAEQVLPARALVGLLDYLLGDPIWQTELLSLLEDISGPTTAYPPIQVRLMASHYLPFLFDLLKSAEISNSFQIDSLERLVTAMKSDPSRYADSMSIHFLLIDKYQKNGRTKEAVSGAGRLKDLIYDQSIRNAGNFDLTHAHQLATVLIDLDQFGEASELVGDISASSQIRRDRRFLMRFETLKEELALLQGRVKLPIVKVWLSPAQNDRAESLVCWEIGSHGMDGASEFEVDELSVFGRDFPVMDGLFDLDIDVISNSGERKTIAYYKETPARGSRYVLLPDKEGTFSPRLHRLSAPPIAFRGMNTTFLATPNLIGSLLQEERTGEGILESNNLPNWQLGETVVEWIQGGPNPDQQALRLEANPSKNTLILGPRIEISEDQNDYLQSIWLRIHDHAEVQWGRRYLDSRGRELRTTFCPAGVPRSKWFQVSQAMTTSLKSNPGADLIHKNTVAIQPVLRIRGMVDIESPFLGRYPRRVFVNPKTTQVEPGSSE